MKDRIYITNKVTEIIELVSGVEVNHPLMKLEYLGDSLDLIESCMNIEAAFDIEISDHVYCNWVTIADVIRDIIELVGTDD